MLLSYGFCCGLLKRSGNFHSKGRCNPIGASQLELKEVILSSHLLQQIVVSEVSPEDPSDHIPTSDKFHQRCGQSRLSLFSIKIYFVCIVRNLPFCWVHPLGYHLHKIVDLRDQRDRYLISVTHYPSRCSRSCCCPLRKVSKTN